MATYSKVLVGTDGSETSLKAVTKAAEVADAHDAELLIGCAYTPLESRASAAAADELGSDAYQIQGDNPAGDIVRAARERERHRIPHAEASAHSPSTLTMPRWKGSRAATGERCRCRCRRIPITRHQRSGTWRSQALGQTCGADPGQRILMQISHQRAYKKAGRANEDPRYPFPASSTGTTPS